MWWMASSQAVLRKIESLQAAENRLLQYAEQYGRRQGGYTITARDDMISHLSVPLKAHNYDVFDHFRSADNPQYVIHSVEVTSEESATETPLVLLHGYMNGGVYFYRNLVGLSRYFSKIHALDLLGWGLSSRPKFELIDTSLTLVEDWYVESLEAWRKVNKIDRMILAGHSMGGYFSVAYCEKYPQHVERLILISPVGVPRGDPDVLKERENMIRSTWRGSIMWNIYHHSFSRYTPGDIIRSLPERNGLSFFQNYIDRRVPAITSKEEKQAVADYLYRSTVLPGSGEYCLNKFLDHNVMALKPCVERIPHLKVDNVSFLYGDSDWMDFTGGMMVMEAVEKEREKLREQGDASRLVPRVDVYKVRQAGHLLMLDNWEEFNTGVILSAGLKPDTKAPVPQKMTLQTGLERKDTKMQTSGEFRKNVKLAT
jgi:cardiolipin-specific phospholipase